ncbi:hypothetical protein N7488_004521 [Penicillium malachiteum]|nr:hypothetical protein N7488_004521 [Penicillium malachiteum]
MSMGYNRGVYGGSISGLWAIMDSAFASDYSIGTDTSAMADRLSFAFAEVTAAAEASASAGPHIMIFESSRVATMDVYARRVSSRITILLNPVHAWFSGTILTVLLDTSWLILSSATFTTTPVVVSRWKTRVGALPC